MGFDSGIASFAPFVTRGTSLPRTQPKPRVPHGMHSVSPNKIFSRLRSRVCCSSCPHPTSPSRALRVGASSRLETMRPGDEALRVLYITLEFRAGAFSGNGVYAQSQARALGRAGHRVLVVCGTPDAPDSASAPDLVSPDLVSPDLVSVVALPVPSSKWGRLDVHSPWRAFADAAGASPDLVSAVRAFDPNVVLGVDWSSLPAWNALRAALDPPPDRTFDPFHPPPFVYANFRVFSRTDPAHESLESDAVAAAAAVVALCGEDADHLARRLAPPRVALAPRIILPPSRRRPKTRARDGSHPERRRSASVPDVRVATLPREGTGAFRRVGGGARTQRRASRRR